MTAAVLATALTLAPATAPAPCTLVDQIRTAGFTGPDVPIVWAIVKRESGGNARAISATGDYGLAQINRATWGDAPWWDTDEMLEPLPNLRAAYRISEGGKTFRAWGLDGQGREHPASPYPRSVWLAFDDLVEKFPRRCR